MSRILSPREVVLYFLLYSRWSLSDGGADFRPLGWVGVLNAAQRHEVTPLFQLHKMSFRINSNYVFLWGFLSSAPFRTRFVCLFIWLVESSRSTQMPLLLLLRGINYFSPALVATCKFNSNSLFLHGELVEEGCLGSLLLVPPRGARVALFCQE